MSCRKRAIAILICAVAAAGHLSAENADDILRKADKAFSVDRVYARSTMTIVRNGRTQKPQEFASYESRSAEGIPRSLTVLLSPQRLAGTAYLMVGNDLWVRFASTGRVRKMSSAARKAAAAGSDFGYNDLSESGSNFSEDYSAKLAGDDRVDGFACWMIELTSDGDQGLYEKILVWVTKEMSRYVQLLYFENGAAIKQMYLSDYRDLNGVYYPFTITMESMVRDSVTTIQTQEMELNSDRVVDRQFTVDYLKAME